MGSRKGKKESKKAAVRTSPRKHTAPTDAAHDEDSQEPSQEARDEPDRGGVLPEGQDDRGSEGDGEKAEKVGTVWTSDQDEQIAAFFEEHTLFYDMSNMEYKNKRKRDNLLLELARTMFETGSLQFNNIIQQCIISLPIHSTWLLSMLHNVLLNMDHNDIWCQGT